jgi:hypothetical protein
MGTADSVMGVTDVSLSSAGRPRMAPLCTGVLTNHLRIESTTDPSVSTNSTSTE